MTRLIDGDHLIAKLAHIYEEAGWRSTEVHFSLSDIIANIGFEQEVASSKRDYDTNRRIALRNAAEERRLIADILDAISYSDVKDVGGCLDWTKDIVDSCSI